MRRETSVDGIVKIFFRLASDCLKQFYIIVTLQKRPKIDTLNFDKLLLQFVVVVIKQAVIKRSNHIASSRKHKISAEKKHKSFARRPHIFTMVQGDCVVLSRYIHTIRTKKAEYSEDGIQLKHDEDDGAKENSLSLSPFISKIVETQLMSRTPEKLFFAMPA